MAFMSREKRLKNHADSQNMLNVSGMMVNGSLVFIFKIHEQNMAYKCTEMMTGVCADFYLCKSCTKDFLKVLCPICRQKK